jgi:hypothetical protein
MAMLMDVLDVFARKYPVNTTINKGRFRVGTGRCLNLVRMLTIELGCKVRNKRERIVGVGIVVCQRILRGQMRQPKQCWVRLGRDLQLKPKQKTI